MILIDPPLWPAHGTVFSHLVSDSSLAELHEFAAAAGVTGRAFDLDHYDVPERIYSELVAAGARPVSGKDLVRALASSGLRVKARHRSLMAMVHPDRGFPNRIFAQQLNKAINQALQQADTAERLRFEGGDVLGGSVESFQQLLKTEIPRWAQIVKDSGAGLD